MDDSSEEPPLARLARRLTLKTESQRQQKLAKDRETLTWLSPIDTETNYKRACHLHQPGTGQWFLNREEFKNWASGESSFIWLHGIPGSGKTVLSSTIITELKHRQQSSEGDDVFSLSYHYLDFKDQRSLDPVTLLGSIIKELYLSLPQTELFEGIQSLYDFHYDKSSGQAQKPSFEDLVSLLVDVAETLLYVLIVVDGLDECPQEYQDQVLCPALKSITSQLEARIGFLVTSREENNIETAFAGLAQVGMSKDNVASDVAIYVEAEIERRASLRNLDLELRDEISKALVAGAQGMFRWVSCQIEVLANARNEAQIALSLKKLPKTLYETYDRIIDNISVDDTKRARRSLTWLANSPRQMSSDELIEAIEIDPGDKSAKRKKPRNLERLLTICGGLIVKNDETDITYVGLAHFSVKEYLHSRYTNPKDAIFKIPEQKANQELSQVCLTYLAFEDFKPGPVLEYKDFEKRLKDYPLLQYAANQTTYHFRRGSPALNGRWFEILFRFTTRKARVNKHLKAWRQARDGFGYHEPYMISEDLEATPLLLAAESGLTSIVTNLIAAGADVNVNGFYGSALLAACSEGHSDIVNELLKAGADMQAQNEELGTPLVGASASGHTDIVRTLLAKGAEVNRISGFHGTAIEAAAYRGNEELVRILLDAGADVNLVAGRYGTPLLAASYKGRESIVRLLVSKGADINVEGTRYGSALRAASEEGHDNVVQYLLENGANLNAVGGEYGTALQAASRSGNESVVKKLLKSGASVDAVGGFYGCALQAAARTDVHVVRALLEAGADVNQICGQYHTALAAATYFGKADIVQLLLDSGATGASEALQVAWVEDKQQVAQVLENWIKSTEKLHL